MNHDEARRSLGAWLDSELDEESRRGAEEHLASCEGCRRRFAAEQGLERSIAARLKARDLAPASFWDEIARRLRSEPAAAPPAIRLTFGRVAAVLAASLLLAAVLFLVIPHPSRYWLAREMQRVHGVLGQEGRLGIASSDSAEVVRFLEGRLGTGFPGIALPAASGPRAHHRFHLVGGGVMALHSGGRDDGPEIPAAWVRYTCCNRPVTLLVLRRGSLGEGTDPLTLIPPGRMEGEGRRSFAVGLRATAETLVFAVSEHQVEDVLDQVAAASGGG